MKYANSSHKPDYAAQQLTLTDQECLEANKVWLSISYFMHECARVCERTSTVETLNSY